MRFTLRWAASLFILLGFCLVTPGSLRARPTTNTRELERISRETAAKWAARRGPEYERFLRSDNPAWRALFADSTIEFIGVEGGRPLFYQVNNLDAARTVGTDKCWPNAGFGFSLTGANDAGELAIWDGGAVRFTHQEFTGRVIVMDGGSAASHATHVAGTMIAAGVRNDAHGMSPEGVLYSYEWTNDNGEMASAAGNGLLVSNHSYSYITGWNYDYGQGIWYWWGDPDISEDEDYNFGFYGYQAQSWDNIAYNAPYYTICKSAGNDRGEGPGGQPVSHYVYIDGDWELNSTMVHERDGGSDGYDCITAAGNSKNIITVGAVNDIPQGYQYPSDVVMSSFSTWGPTDDGRVKPDLVANGIQLYSSVASSNTAYSSYSGTSMSSPNLAGSLNLLVQYYKDTHGGDTPLSATMKALMVHTADEAGSGDGPDYRFGWGLLNTFHAAEVIRDDEEDYYRIQESTLTEGDTVRYTLLADGNEPLTATIAWTDPPASPPSAALNPPDLMLVNDLDMRLIHVGTGTEFEPWVLDPANPSAAATTGDNFRDNVEEIFVDVPDALAGDYVLEVHHKNTLTGGEQPFSLVLSGLWASDDPRVTPEGLTAELDNVHGIVILHWHMDADLTDFVAYRVYRDGEEIATTADTMWVDIVTEFGSYVYTVTSQWAQGQSHPTPPLTVTWYEPVAPTALAAEYDAAAGAVNLSWGHLRGGELAYDDGSAESNLAFAASAPEGSQYANRITVPDEADMIAMGAWVLELGMTSFGPIRFALYADDGGLPGELLYMSEPRTPEEEGWFWITMPPDTAVTLAAGSEVWVAVDWVQMGHTKIGRDTTPPLLGRGAFTIGPDAWEPLDDFGGGVLAGNPMLRLSLGSEEPVGPERGLTEYRVERDGEPVGTTAERFWVDSDPPDTVVVYQVVAEYEQGEAASDTVSIDLTGTAVEDEAALPARFEIGGAYPNPFNPEMTIPFSLPRSSEVTAEVFDLLGRRVATLAAGRFQPGRHRLSWNAAEAASGVYFVRVQAGPVHAVRKVVLLR